jgi:transposase
MNEPTRKPPKHFDREFKLAALELWRTSGKTRKEVGAELGISEWNLRDWKEALDPKRTAKSTPRPQTQTELEVENSRLRQENQRLRNQRDILKKSLGILCEPLNNASHT